MTHTQNTSAKKVTFVNKKWCTSAKEPDVPSSHKGIEIYRETSSQGKVSSNCVPDSKWTFSLLYWEEISPLPVAHTFRSTMWHFTPERNDSIACKVFPVVMPFKPLTSWCSLSRVWVKATSSDAPGSWRTTDGLEWRTLSCWRGWEECSCARLTTVAMTRHRPARCCNPGETRIAPAKKNPQNMNLCCAVMVLSIEAKLGLGDWLLFVGHWM